MSSAAYLSANYDTHFDKEQDQIDHDGVLEVSSTNKEQSQFKDFLPTWDPREKYPPLKFFKHDEPGLRADASYPNLFPGGRESHKTKNITPKLGSVVFDVQLSELNDAGKDELAHFVATRGVVVFRDQDFASKGADFVVNYARHFGRLHIHPTSGHPRNHPELHITYRRANPKEFERVYANRNNAIQWHSDISYELQPPGTTFFSVLEGPESGGDTIFADTEEAYDRLSPAFRERLHGLHVLHTSEDQAANSKGQGGIERRKPVSNIHPLIRTHPVTKRKSIFLNRPFSRRIVELKEEESDYLLKFLYDHIELSHDLQLRASWEPNSVVIWDNRNVSHSAVLDWDTPISRHAFRLTPQAERPVEDLNDLNREEYDVGDVQDALKNVLIS